MFHRDISFSDSEKAEQFSEDGRIFLSSFKDAISYIK
jgi:hypothetical protein